MEKDDVYNFYGKSLNPCNELMGKWNLMHDLFWLNSLGFNSHT